MTEGKWKELLQKINECSGFVTIIFFTEYRVYICVRKNVSSFKKASFCCSFFCSCLMYKFLSFFSFLLKVKRKSDIFLLVIVFQGI